MPTAIDQRLASLLHQRRIRAFTRIDRLTAQVGQLYNRMGTLLLRLAAVPPADIAARIDQTTATAFGDVHELIRTGFTSEARASHTAAADALLRAVPWRWFRKVHPLVMEAEQPVFDWGTLTKDEKRAVIQEMLFEPPNAEQVEEWLEYAGPDGLAWDERLAYWEAGTRERIRTGLIAGITDPAGVGVPSLRKILDPLVGDIRYKAQRIARTEGRRVAEMAQQHAYQQVADLLDGMQIIATLDAHTRAHHAARHGKRYRQEGPERYVAADGEALPVLPDEPNCRCYASPILAVPAEVENDPLVRAQFENVDHDVIPDPGAYNQWWANATEAEKKRSVGARRFNVVAQRLASQGRRPEWEDFLDPTGRLMPVDKLKRQTWKAWEGRRGKVAEMVAERERVMRQVAATGFDAQLAGRAPVAARFKATPRTVARTRIAVKPIKPERLPKPSSSPFAGILSSEEIAALPRSGELRDVTRSAEARIARLIAERNADPSRYVQWESAKLVDVQKRFAENVRRLKAARKAGTISSTEAALLEKQLATLKQITAEVQRRKEIYDVVRQARSAAESARLGKIALQQGDVAKLLSDVQDVYWDAGWRPSQGKPPYSPELFITSDISGKPIRHYVRLPDGRIAHPDELKQAKQRGNVVVIGEIKVPNINWAQWTGA